MILPSMLVWRGIARGVHVAASLSILGIAGGRVLIVPEFMLQAAPDACDRITRHFVRLIRLSLVLAILAGAAWLLLEAIYVTGSDAISAGIGALAPVVWDTNFGHLLIIRLALLVIAAGVFGNGGNRRRAIAATGLALLAIALQAGLGHGAAMGGLKGYLLLAALILHLIAAGLWLGGLLPLYIAINAGSAKYAYHFAQRFSTLGTICVVTLATTAALQAWFLIGGIPGLIGTDYGRVAMAKMFLFLVLIGMAAFNRFLFTPALNGSQGSAAISHLSRSIIVETLAGLIVVTLAGILLELPPGMDMPSMKMPGMAMPSRTHASSSAILGKRSPTLALAAPESGQRHNSP